MTATEKSATLDRYIEPGWFTQHVFNRFVAWPIRRGLSLWGSRVLDVRGRVSGEWRSVPVNLLEFDGATYIVAPRGVTQWVRNLRVASVGRLRLGKGVDNFDAVELSAADAVPVLRAYLARWKWEVGQFFDGVGPDASDEELLAVAEHHPVFRVTLG